jgi:hypothetical protein
MKNRFLILLSLALFTMLIWSCNKEESLDPQDVSEEMTVMEDFENEMDALADAEAFNFTEEVPVETRNDCAVVTTTKPRGEFPNTITIDFGDGCEGDYGRVRKGKIIINISDNMKNVGAVRTITFEDFFIDDVEITGTRTLTNTGLNSDGKPTFSLVITEFTLTFPNGDQAVKNVNRIHTFVQGFLTPNRLDDIWAITGTANGVTRDGNTFTVTITTPLIKKGSCRWIVEGVIEITTETATISLDFGDGACNGVGVITLPDGTTKEINLYRRWWRL